MAGKTAKFGGWSANPSENRVIWGKAHISAIYNSEGNLHYFLAIIKDISERYSETVYSARNNGF